MWIAYYTQNNSLMVIWYIRDFKAVPPWKIYFVDVYPLLNITKRSALILKWFWKEGRKEGNVLFNDALNTFYLRVYGVGHMVEDHSDRKPTAATWATLSD